MTRRTTHSTRRRAVSPSGFTLMELMVSIALVLIIILGVNTVFRITSDTVNAGMAIGAAARDQRAITTVLGGDLHAGVFENSPCLIIRSERVGAFRSAAEAQSDRDGNPLTTDMDADNQEGEPNVPGEQTSLATMNGRNHRVDRVMFFVNGLFRRQTGGTGTYVDDESSTEAYVWYGHTRQPNNRTANFAQSGQTNAAYYNPGAPDSDGPTTADRNDNNRHATQWILGRSVIVLRETPQGMISSPTQNNYFDDVPIASALNLSPLSPGTMSRGPNPQRLSWSRFDVAQTSINAFRNKLSLYETIHETNPPSDNRLFWWNLLSDERFVAFPYPDRPMTPYGVARTMPVFVPGCTQFAVEYAGDYLNQDPVTGDILGDFYRGGYDGVVPGVDGVIDFIIPDPAMDPAPYNMTYRNDHPTRRVRWYGMPRNVETWDDRSGVAMVRGTGGNPNVFLDVVPLRDILAINGTDVSRDRNFFERDVYASDPTHLRNVANYAAAGAMPANQRFVVAWGPRDLVRGSRTKPKMLRFVVAVDDPRGRLTEGQTFEYVYEVP